MSSQANKGVDQKKPLRASYDPIGGHSNKKRLSQNSPNKILDWVTRLEKINATQESKSFRRPTNDSNVKTTSDKYCVEDGTPQLDAVDEEELCFKSAQLATEFLLMVFAASLLMIATIVILSKKVPSFMEGYELLPEILFFLCIFVGAFSFLCWLIRKLSCRRKKSVKRSENKTSDKKKVCVGQRGQQQEQSGGDNKVASGEVDVTMRRELKTNTTSPAATLDVNKSSITIRVGDSTRLLDLDEIIDEEPELSATASIV